MKGAGARMRAAFALMLAMLALGTLLAGMAQRERAAFDIGDYSGVNLDEARAAWERGGSNEQLAELLKALCYFYAAEGREALGPEIRELGQELLDRAREGRADLEAMDDERESILQVLALARSLGAR